MHLGLAIEKVMRAESESGFTGYAESTKRLIWFVRFRSGLVAEYRAQIFR
jgi:hypothetical protein